MATRTTTGARHGLAGVVAAAVLTVALAACGGDGSGTADTSSAATAEPATTAAPTTTTAPPTTTTVVSEEEAVIAAYQGFWQMWIAANDPPDPDSPEIERFAVGRELAVVKSAIQRQQAEGEILRLPAGTIYQHVVAVEEIAGLTATVTDCGVDDGLVLDRRTGRVLNDAVYTHAYRAAMVKQEGQWLVEKVDLVGKWDGVAGCAA